MRHSLVDVTAYRQSQVGFTGTRSGMTGPQSDRVEELLEALDPAGFHHGCCRGADAEAHLVAYHLGVAVVGHPPLDDRLMMPLQRHEFSAIRPRKTYLERDRNIVYETAVLIGAPKHYRFEPLIETSWYTISWALRTPKPVFIVWPDGDVEERS